jgi:sodium/hydrogen exchanger 10/11
MSLYGKYFISPASEHALHHVWGYVGFAAESLIFIVSGVIIGERIVIGQFVSPDGVLNFSDLACLLAGWILLHFVRFICIFLFWYPLMKTGYGMTFNQVLLGSYAGLRGAVGLSLALMVVQSDKISDYVKNVILLHVAGVALLTLLVNATTTGMVVNYLHLADYTDWKKN